MSSEFSVALSHPFVTPCSMHYALCGASALTLASASSFPLPYAYYLSLNLDLCEFAALVSRGRVLLKVRFLAEDLVEELVPFVDIVSELKRVMLIDPSGEVHEIDIHRMGDPDLRLRALGDDSQ